MQYEMRVQCRNYCFHACCWRWPNFHHLALYFILKLDFNFSHGGVTSWKDVILPSVEWKMATPEADDIPALGSKMTSCWTLKT